MGAKTIKGVFEQKLLSYITPTKNGIRHIIVGFPFIFCMRFIKLEELTVLKRSPDLLNNVKIGLGQLRLIIETYFVLPYKGNGGHFGQVTLNNLMNTPYEI